MENGSRNPPKVSRKPNRERSSSVTVGLLKPSAFTRAKIGGWQAIALNFHDQVFHEVERLIKKIDVETNAIRASDLLKQAQIPSGNRGKMTPEGYTKKTEHLVTLLQRLAPQQVILQAPPT